MNFNTHKIRFDSIRFDSIRFDSIRFDSIRFDSIRFDSIRFDSIRFDSIQFDSIQSPRSRCSEAPFVTTGSSLKTVGIVQVYSSCCSHQFCDVRSVTARRPWRKAVRGASASWPEGAGRSACRLAPHPSPASAAVWSEQKARDANTLTTPYECQIPVVAPGAGFTRACKRAPY